MFEVNVMYSVTVHRGESGFDKACDQAYQLVCKLAQLDEDGYCKNVKGWERSTDVLAIQFHQYTRIGSSHIYLFSWWVQRNEDD